MKSLERPDVDLDFRPRSYIWPLGRGCLVFSKTRTIDSSGRVPLMSWWKAVVKRAEARAVDNAKRCPRPVDRFEHQLAACSVAGSIS